jgi:GNAT superfamily N-acetyltransferase
MGLNYTAVDQSSTVTRERIAAGQCWVAERDRRMLGTITLARPRDSDVEPYRLYPAIHQLAVEPSAQRLGIGGALMDTAEACARRTQDAVVLDTAESAQHLIDGYRRRGCAQAALAQWPGKVYRSVVLVKPLRVSNPHT